MAVDFKRRPMQDVSQSFRRGQDVESAEQHWKGQGQDPNQRKQQAVGQENMAGQKLKRQQSLQKLRAAQSAQAISKVKQVNAVDAVDAVDALDGDLSFSTIIRKPRASDNPNPTKDIQVFCQPPKADPKWFQLDEFKSTCSSIQEKLLMSIGDEAVREKIMHRTERLLGEEVQARNLLESYMNALVMV